MSPSNLNVTKHVEELGKKIRPSSFEPSVSEVTCTLTDEMLDAYVEALAQIIVQADVGGSMDLKETTNELKTYIKQLIIFRIRYVRGERIPMHPKDRGWIVPAFISIVLEQIGRVDDPTTGLILTPALTKEQTETPLWDEVTLLKKGRWLRMICDRANIEYAIELPAQKEGNPEMMTLQVIDDEVRGEDGTHAGVYALIAGFLGIKVLENVLCPRVLYDSTATFSRLLARVPDYELKSRG
jgi:hypothetical protein